MEARDFNSKIINSSRIPRQKLCFFLHIFNIVEAWGKCVCVCVCMCVRVHLLVGVCVFTKTTFKFF